MARTKKDRLIQMAPHFNGFTPEGVQNKPGSVVIINFEEHEALSLCDFEGLTQAEAAKLMNISRPTFTRIYESVRKKVATAFVEGSAIRFECGGASISNWYKCPHCKISYTLSKDSEKRCPLCKTEVVTINN